MITAPGRVFDTMQAAARARGDRQPLVVAVTGTPVLCAYLPPNAKAVTEERERRLVTWLKAHYERVLEGVLARPKA